MPTSVFSPVVARFGVFEADLRSGELRKSGIRVKVQEIPFRALRLLLAHPNEVVSRDQLRQALWPDDVHVDFDRGVISAINRLRDALGDSAENPVFIETVGRRGYRWIAPTLAPQPATPEPALAPEARADASTIPISEISVAPPQHSPLWIWLLFVPTLAVLATGGIYRWTHRTSANSATPAALGRRSTHHPADHGAEDFYLKGRFYWNERTPDSLNQAVDFFTQAIVHDPNYAPAYVGLADCYNLLREYSVMPGSEAYPRALAAAKKATEIDADSSEAHASLAFVSFNGMWDFPTADREYRRAIELDPNNGIAHHWYATTLAALARYPEAISEIERSQALDPASKSILADKGRILWLAGRHEEATALLKQMEAAEPGFMSPHRYLKLAYLESGDYPDYLVEMKHEALLTHDHPAMAIAEAAGKGFASDGEQGLLRSQLEEERKFYAMGRFSPYLLAETCALLGDKAAAQQYLEAAYAKRADELPNIEIDPTLKPLHREPAFRLLVAKIGLPPVS
jgi:DNA-binding winged helix-turn-helix (wHTH) protein/tetratricopeptide (TPR) repeat protein